jgi:hypothetical protein
VSQTEYVLITQGIPIMKKPARVTVSISPESQAIYQRMAKAGGMSFSRCVGEWLDDMGEAAMFTAIKMEEARSAPQRVMMEVLGKVHGLKDAVLQVKHDVRVKAAGKPQAAVRGQPPSSNTGGYGIKRSGPK